MPSELKIETWKSRNFLLPLLGMLLYSVLFGLGAFKDTATGSAWTLLCSDKVIAAIFFMVMSGTFTLNDLAKTWIHKRYPSKEEGTE